jgi:CYTH domain-containing protein
MIEIERRFLCRRPDPHLLAEIPVRRITQGYLSSGPPTVRIRRQDGTFILTIKAGQGLVRQEIELPVPPGPGAELLDLAGDFRIEKVRYEIGRWELDCFQGKLAGLVMAEIELTGIDEPLPPVPAGIELLREVTTVPGYTNAQLAHLDEEAARRFVHETQMIGSPPLEWPPDAAPPGRNP